MKDMLNKNDKYQLIILFIVAIFIILVLLVLIVGKVDISKKNKGTIAKVINDDALTINYVDGDEVSFFDNKEHEYGISITNNSPYRLYYSIFFDSVNTEEAKVVVEDYDGNVVNEISNKLSTTKLINLYSIEGETTVRYKIIISNEEKLSFKAVLKVVNESTSKESFSDVLLINNEIKKPKTRIGSEIATTDEGLIETVDNKGTSYYFRGNVKNNYVKLGDLLFRIVRINGDGTVRMVLDGVIENQYPYNTNEPTEEVSSALLSGLGYSTVLGELNNWYNEKLGAYDMYLANTDFCTDTSFNRELNGIYYSNSFDRIFVDGAPDLYCSGTIYTGKVGLLSADEVLLAGAYADVTNSDFYLYNSEIKGNYVTNSSYSMVEGRAHMINVMANGAFGDSVDIGTETFIRPVVSMGISAKLKGDGTKSNPYIIVA